MRSLWLKLLLAFALVILIGALVNSLLMSYATQGQVQNYVSQNGQIWAAQSAPIFADYYAATGSWQGADVLLWSPWAGMMMEGMQGGGMMGQGMMGPGMMMQGQMPALNEATAGAPGSEPGQPRVVYGIGSSLWDTVGFQPLLTDADGAVVATAGAFANDRFAALLPSPAQLAAAAPIEVKGRRVGSLLVVPTLAVSSTPANDFLQTLIRATWLSSLAAGVIALGLGLVLFRQIVAPVRAVTTAAQQIAAGRFAERVPVTSRDEIGQLAVSFNQMAAALEADQRLRQAMIADVAHELRTPLSVIQANLEAMLDGVLPATPQEIASLHEETTLLTRLVNDLRLLSLAEAGQLKLERQPTDVGELAHRIGEQIAGEAEAARVVAVVADPGLPLVLVDKHRIDQVMSNLMRNALHYTPAGGCISVRVSATAPAAEPGEVTVSVSDTGCGIAPENLPYVFDRFYRADASRTRSSGGSGIGLAIVKQLVELHGGRIWATSEVGAGSTFAFTLPSTVAGAP